MATVGLWAFFFGDGVGSDGSGNGNSAFLRNGATQDDAGRVNLDGVNDYVEIANAPQYALQQGTIHASFTAAAGSMDGTRSTNINDSSLQALVSRDSQGFDTGGHLTIYLDGDGSLWVRHQSATEDYFIRTAANTVQAGREFDLTYEFSDSKGLILYIDGKNVGSNVAPVTNGDSIALAQNSEPWTLGASQSTSGDGVADVLQQHFTGKIGHFEIYDQALPPSQLNTLHDLSDGVDDGHILGTAGNDTIHGGNAIGVADGGAVSNDAINAGAGNDVVFAGDGNDIIEGGAGDDSIYAGSGADKVRGGVGNDTIFGGIGNDTLEGGAGEDIINGEAGDDSISGGDGNDRLDGGLGQDTLEGGQGNDWLDGGEGNDRLTGGEGNDRFNVSRGHDTITDFNSGNTGPLGDGDSHNNDFLNVGNFYDSLSELRADQADDGILNQSNSFDDKGRAVDYSNNTQFGPNSSITVQNANANTYSHDNTGVVCFAAGARIMTPLGEVEIETLQPGDLVNTLDHGPQPLLWIGSRHVTYEELTANEKLRPVLIAKGALGNSRDLLVYRQHGMMIGPDHFVRAIHLARELPGVRIANGKRKVTYVHLFFSRHEIVFAEGVPSESFYPGPDALKMMSPNERSNFLSFFPSLKTQAALRDIKETEAQYGKPARVFAKLNELNSMLRVAA